MGFFDFFKKKIVPADNCKQELQICQNNLAKATKNTPNSEDEYFKKKELKKTLALKEIQANERDGLTQLEKDRRKHVVSGDQVTEAAEEKMRQQIQQQEQLQQKERQQNQQQKQNQGLQRQQELERQRRQQELQQQELEKQRRQQGRRNTNMKTNRGGTRKSKKSKKSRKTKKSRK